MCSMAFEDNQPTNFNTIVALHVTLSLATINIYKCLYKFGLGDINVWMLDSKGTAGVLDLYLQHPSNVNGL